MLVCELLDVHDDTRNVVLASLIEGASAAVMNVEDESVDVEG